MVTGHANRSSIIHGLLYKSTIQRIRIIYKTQAHTHTVSLTKYVSVSTTLTTFSMQILFKTQQNETETTTTKTRREIIATQKCSYKLFMSHERSFDRPDGLFYFMEIMLILGIQFRIDFSQIVYLETHIRILFLFVEIFGK